MGHPQYSPSYLGSKARAYPGSPEAKIAQSGLPKVFPQMPLNQPAVQSQHMLSQYVG